MFADLFECLTIPMLGASRSLQSAKMPFSEKAGPRLFDSRPVDVQRDEDSDFTVYLRILDLLVTVQIALGVPRISQTPDLLSLVL